MDAVVEADYLGMIRQWQEIIYDENYHSATAFRYPSSPNSSSA